ncbi:TKL protein kinase [Saprolegnia diclina VS20]|uniref:TKL protein kinase n=1 Tax=Saprolegnia diclina (strain VS20) TaxID=1156394 RepID=T0PUK2_SAPDV|nr:TKL protein kinase [Saprolegnia diclina VS20]EQC29199.1 TKL protein kinase [Saprolegnia diclina VS20]|eukprot:XP_008617377.1 TKL protein kinase [Saprolegnia diclina VS20]
MTAAAAAPSTASTSAHSSSAVIGGAVVGLVAVVAVVALCAHRDKSLTQRSKTRSLSCDAYPVLETPHLRRYPGTIAVESNNSLGPNARSIRTSWGPSLSDDSNLYVKPIRMFRLELADLHVTSTKPLASGTYGEIWFGRYDREPVAIKRLKNKTPERVQTFVDEMLLMSRMNSPYIVQFIGVSWELPIDMECVVEYMDMGDLRTYLTAVTRMTFTWRAKQASMAGIARGLDYLHSLETPVMHRDLKSRNVLLDSRKGTKLTDFGDLRESTATSSGAFEWTAPEVLRGQAHSPASDVYAFGVILSELSTHKVPYYESKTHSNSVALLHQVMQGKARPLFDKSHTPAWVLELAMQCLAMDPARRPTAAALVAHLDRVR